MVRHSTLTAIFAGSNPVSPVCLSIDRQKTLSNKYYICASIEQRTEP